MIEQRDDIPPPPSSPPPSPSPSDAVTPGAPPSPAAGPASDDATVAETKVPIDPELKREAGGAIAVWMGLVIGSIALLGTLTIWHLARRGRMLGYRRGSETQGRPGPAARPATKVGDKGGDPDLDPTTAELPAMKTPRGADADADGDGGDAESAPDRGESPR